MHQTINEIWKDVEGYEGYYQVSNLGRVKSLPKKHRYGSKSEKILGRKNMHGYKRVSLCKDAKTKDFLIHRLVAAAFIPNPNNKPTINHINGIKDDNRVDNLEWATNLEQNLHAWNTGLKVVTEKWKQTMKLHIGRKRSTETKLKMRLAKLGKTPWNKGMTKQQEYEYRMAKNN